MSEEQVVWLREMNARVTRVNAKVSQEAARPGCALSAVAWLACGVSMWWWVRGWQGVLLGALVVVWRLGEYYAAAVKRMIAREIDEAKQERGGVDGGGSRGARVDLCERAGTRLLLGDLSCVGASQDEAKVLLRKGFEELKRSE
jgi:hypothetical protein